MSRVSVKRRLSHVLNCCSYAKYLSWSLRLIMAKRKIHFMNSALSIPRIIAILFFSRWCFRPEVSLRNIVKCNVNYGVPLRSKYPDSEMLFQKQNISRDLQNMMRKLYFIDPDQKKFEFHFSIIRLPMEKKKIRGRKFDDVTNWKKSRVQKKKFEVEILSRNYERTLTSCQSQSVDSFSSIVYR